MKIIYNLAFIMLFMIVGNLSAQKISVELGPQIKFDNDRSYPTLLYGDNTGYYIWSKEYGGLFSSKSSSFLEKLDTKLNLVSSKEFLSLEDDVYDEGIEYFNGQLIWMVSERDKKNDRITYKVKPISLEGKGSKSVTLSRFKYEKKRDIPETRWYFNADTTNLLFLAESDNNSKKEQYQIHLVSIDKDLNTMWDKTFQFRKTEAQTTLLSKELNKQGEAYLLYKVYEDKKKEKKGGKPAYDIELFYIKNDTAEVKKFNLDIKDSFIKSANLKLRENGELYCIGLYSNTVDGPTHGVFFMKLENGEVSIATKRSFSEEEIEKLGDRNTDKDKSGEDGLNDDFRFRSIEILSDGSAFVTVEPNYIRISRSMYANGRTTETTTYFSEDIIIINILPDGEVSSLNIIPKLQRNNENAIFLSHKSFKYNDKIYVFYNEDEDNYKKPIGAKPKTTSKFSDFVATMTTLDKDGNFERNALFSHTDTGSILIPDDIKKITDTKYFFITVQRKFLSSRSKFTFGTINLSPY